MKSWLDALRIALSMYSTLPVRCLDWNTENLRHAMLFFPIVGILCGIWLWLVWILCCFLQTGSFLFAVLALLSYIFITGGIHLDGFCDTADALFSRRPMETKLKILKDPNCGSFAVCSCIMILLLQTACYTELFQKQPVSIVWFLTGGFFLSRCLSGISVTCFPCAPTSALTKTFGEHAARNSTGILIIQFLTAGIFLTAYYHLLAIFSIALLLAVFFWYYRMQKKEFGGITGDIAGFFLVLCESIWLLSAALLGGVLL